MDFDDHLSLAKTIDDFEKEVGIDAGDKGVTDRAAQSSLPKMVFVSHLSPAMRISELEKELGIDAGGEENRYLCVTHGAAIYCLDLKRGEVEFNDDPQPLPIVDTLNLHEGASCPISPGLIKLGPDVLIVKGSEPLIHQLWLIDGILRISPLYTYPLLSMPKIWPIVEKFGNQIHVIECCPRFISDGSVIPTHEVLDPDNLHSEVVSPMQHINGCHMVMSGHLVLGDKIFAKAHGTFYDVFYVFDCKTKKWELHKCSETETHLTFCYSFEYSICVERFYEMGSEVPFYLVINFGGKVPLPGDVEDMFRAVSAEAQGVTEMGYVRWSQGLPQFFEGLAPMIMSYAHIFRVDEKTMCVVMRAKQYLVENSVVFDENVENVLYISTFVVEESSQWKDGCVEVVLKERHIYKVGDDFPIMPPRLRACFLKFEGV